MINTNRHNMPYVNARMIDIKTWKLQRGIFYVDAKSAAALGVKSSRARGTGAGERFLSHEKSSKQREIVQTTRNRPFWESRVGKAT